MISVPSLSLGKIVKKRNHPHTKAIRRSSWVAIFSSSHAAWVLALMWAYKDANEPPSELEQRIARLEKKEKRRRFCLRRLHIANSVTC